MSRARLALRRYSTFAVKRLPLFAASLWIVAAAEALGRGRWIDAALWSVSSVPQLALNGLLVLGLLLLFISATGKPRIAYWTVSALLLALGLVNGIKINVLGVPLLPWDVLLAHETKGMAGFAAGMISGTTVFVVAVFVAVSVALARNLRGGGSGLGGRRRVSMAVGSVAIACALCADETLSIPHLARVQNIVWDPAENVQKNGFLLATAMNLKALAVSPPDGYDGQAVSAVASAAAPAVPKADGVKPNLIFVLNESFWDPTQMNGVRFSPDPLPYYHSLIETCTSGTLLSPQFGGGTANVEFEVLTGASMRFLPSGTVPYNQYIFRDIESLASLLTRQGYEATAISAFHSWYFNSSKVYERLGFTRYIPQEFFEPDYEGPYIADRAVAKYIIETAESTPGPDFIFADTMQNHFHYLPGKFKENTVSVAGVSGESRGLLETYAQGLTGADDMLRRLITHFERRGEPTIVVFFGDHLPSLGDNYKAYRESGFLREKDPDVYGKLHRVPVVVWNNYLPKEQKERLHMNASFLGPYVLQLAQRPGNYFTDYLAGLQRRYPVLPPKSDGASEPDLARALSGYERLQYDMMFGRRYAAAGTPERDNAAFILGFGTMAVDGVREERTGQGSLLTILGRHLPYKAVVCLNGKPVPAKWVSAGEMRAEIGEQTAGRKPWTIDVYVKDSRERIIARSNSYTYAD